MKKVLITGATGFLGSHLVERNLKAGNQVCILALPDDPKAEEYETRDIRVVYGDIRDYPAVAEATKGIQIVFHLAAIVTDWAPKELFRQVNVSGMRNICKASLEHKIERMVFVSTNDVFGLREDAIINETFEYKPWGEPYPDTKLEATMLAWEYYEKGLAISMVYPCWIYGPGDLTFVPAIADAVMKGEMIFWRKDVIIWPAYIDNVVDLLMVIAEHPAAIGQGFLAHDGVSETFQNFATRIAESIGAKSPTLQIPFQIAYTGALLLERIWKILEKKRRPLLTKYIVKNLGSRLRFSIEKAEKLLDWKPPISYQEGFEKTMEWLKQTHLNSRVRK